MGLANFYQPLFQMHKRDTEEEPGIKLKKSKYLHVRNHIMYAHLYV